MKGSKSDVLVECIGVEKAYGHGNAVSTALAGVDLRLQRGEFVALVGPSGSGKSTLLNLIAGLDRLDRGRIGLGGQDLSAMSDNALADLRFRTIGFVFQAFNLLPALTAHDNVALPLRFAGVAKGEIADRVRAMLDRVGVSNVGGRYPAEASGGEQQRVAIARALIMKPSLLLADEPTGSLDSATGRTVLELLRDLNAKEGLTVLMVTHNATAADYSDRVVELRAGRVWRSNGRDALDVDVTSKGRRGE